MTLPPRHPEPEVAGPALRAVFDWSYSGELEALRDLYAGALERQWVALRDLDWSRPPGAPTGLSMGMIPVERTRFWSGLSPELRSEVARRTAAFLLSNFLHGEQGALLVASQLVNAVPEMEAKLYAATQTLDEARHVETFTTYLDRLGGVQPAAPALRALLTSVSDADDWLHKFVGMQIVTEGVALYSFREARRQTGDPLLEEILRLVSRDEARHTAYGLRYLERAVPTLDTRRRKEAEDFAFETCRTLIDSSQGRSFRASLKAIWAAAGVDPREVFGALLREQESLYGELRRSAREGGPVLGFVLPALRRIGLVGERMEERYRELVRGASGPLLARLLEGRRELPEDLESWVEA